jgi:hypothetical protein
MIILIVSSKFGQSELDRWDRVEIEVVPEGLHPYLHQSLCGGKRTGAWRGRAGEWDPIENDSETRGSSALAALNLYMPSVCRGCGPAQ